jgi:phenylacetate-CoA ligase
MNSYEPSGMTALRDGGTWLPGPRLDNDFVERFTEVTERHYSRTLSAKELKEWRSHQLREVLTKVTERSPFYKRHFAEFDVASIGLDNLSTLPFTTKQDLRREMFDVLSGDVSEATFFYETTGTTGRATPCPRDEKEIISSNTHITESWRAIFTKHFGDRRPAVGLMGPTEIHSFGDTLGDVARSVGSCNAKIWPYSPVVGFRKALDIMRDLRLEVIVATPGVCLNLARAARHYGFDIKRDFSVKLFFLTGEMCTPALSTNVDAIWGVTTYNILYGSQEAFVMGVACPSGGMRLAETNYIVEVIDPKTSESLGERGTGELCVTMVADGIKPLVRFRTGDVVRIADDAGRDGDLPGPMIEVLGRVLDQIVIGGNQFAAAAIENAVLDGVTDCYGYQVVIDRDPASSADLVTVRVELADSAADHVPAQCLAIARRFKDDFGVRCHVEILDELDAVVSTGAFVSWKAARILDRRSDPGHEERVASRLAKGRGITT